MRNLIMYNAIINNIHNYYLSVIDKDVLKLSERMGTDDPAVIYNDVIVLGLMHEMASNITTYIHSTGLDLCEVFVKMKNSILSNEFNKSEFIRIGYMSIIYLVYSKYIINNINVTMKIGIVVPVYNELERMHKYSEKNLKGQNALQAKVLQYLWLFQENKKIESQLLFVDDFDERKSGEEILNLLYENKVYNQLKPNMKIEVFDMINIARKYKTNNSIILLKLSNNKFKSIKGGSVLYGLEYFVKEQYDFCAYYDFDVTHPIDHLGVMTKKILDNPKYGMVINSRRKNDSFGYFYNGKQNMIASLFQAINRELIVDDITDINVGCKLINLKAFAKVIAAVSDFTLSFDSELVVLIKKAGYLIGEVPGCFMHKYVEGNIGVARDYGKMIENLFAKISINSATLNEQKRLYTIMNAYGGFDNLVSAIELYRKEHGNIKDNNEVIEQFVSDLEK